MTPRSHNANVRLPVHVTSWPALEDAVFTLLSVLVVVAAMVIVLAPPRMSIGMQLEEAHAVAGGKAIDIYGSLLDSNGKPIKGATVEIFDRMGNRVGIAHTDNNGFFDTKFWQERGMYTVRITENVNGVGQVVGSMSLDAQPGYTYGVRATLTQTNVIVFVPVPGY